MVDESLSHCSSWSVDPHALLGRQVSLDVIGSVGAFGAVVGFSEMDCTFTINTLVTLTPSKEDLIVVPEEQLIQMLLPENLTEFGPCSKTVGNFILLPRLVGFRPYSGCVMERPSIFTVAWKLLY